MGNKPHKDISNDTTNSFKPSIALSRNHEGLGRSMARRRFYNAHHTWNQLRDPSGNDSMFEFIRNCHCDKIKEKNANIFYLLIDKLLSNINCKMSQIHPHNDDKSRIINKRIIRCMRLLHAWMTLAINYDKHWIFCDMGLILKSMYDSHNDCNRIIIDYERIMGDLLCQCTLKKREEMIKYMVSSLQIDVNLSCEGGETPLIICAEHNLPEITLFLLSAGADANCNNYLLSDSSNSPAQISASWQHLKVLYYLIIYGANYNYYNIHLRSVKQYAKENHLINYIVQKALNKKVIRDKNINKMLYRMLLDPIEYLYHFKDDNDSDSFSSDSIQYDDDLFPTEDNVINFNINFGDSNHIDNQIRTNITKSMKFIKKNRNSHSSSNKKTKTKDDFLDQIYDLRMYHDRDEHKVYLIKDIVSIIYAMIV